MLTRSQIKCLNISFCKWRALFDIYKASNKIARAWKKCFHAQDPITLERIRKAFPLIRRQCVHNYDAYSLFQYILSSGDYRDPITRIEYDSCELMRLARCSGHDNVYLIENRALLLQKRSNYLTSNSLCDAFEHEFNEQINILRSMSIEFSRVEQIQMHWIDIIYENEILPVLLQCFENFKEVNSERCRTFLEFTWSYTLSNQPLSDAELQWNVRHLISIFMSNC